jgi:Family of unknown function (DUF5518)
MAEETRQNLATGVIAGAIIMAVIDLLVPFAGPVIGGFTTGYIVKGDAARRAGAGMLAGLLAAIVIAIAVYQRLVHTQGMGYLAGWGTGLFLYLLVGLYFFCLAFLGAVLAVAVRK